MFQDTLPTTDDQLMAIVGARRHANGKVIGTVLGCGIVLNEDGYCLTAGHVLEGAQDLAQQPAAPGKGKNRITDSVFFAVVQGKVRQFLRMAVSNVADVGVAQLREPPPPSYQFPVLRTSTIPQGEMLCRVGYPALAPFRPTFTEGQGFNFPPSVLSLPSFASSTMVGRVTIEPQGNIWIETGEPGLPGQSGGPLVDLDGRVCGIQARTAHLPLGRQHHVHVGQAVHIAVAMQMLDERGISYQKGG